MTNKTIHSPEKIPALWTSKDCYMFLNISRSSWYAGVAEGRFPKPVLSSPRMSRWQREDVLAILNGGYSCTA